MLRRLFCTILLLLAFAPSLQAAVDLVTLPTRDATQLTIYNSEDITMIREHRLLTVKAGVNRIQFSWANTLIDPTSIEFRILDHQDKVDLADTTFPAGRNEALQWNIKSRMAGQHGAHTAANTNYFAGWNTTTELRDYFVFDLTSVSQTIVGAELSLFNPSNGYVSSNSTQTYTNFDVSTPISALEATNSAQTAIFNDLGSGTALATTTVSAADNGVDILIPLNAGGLSYLNATRGSQVAVGGAITNIVRTTTQSVFEFSGTTSLNTLILTYATAATGDWYSINVPAAGIPLTLSTTTPADGSSHTYNFYNIGLDGAGNVEAAPAGGSQVAVTAAFAPPSQLAVTGFSVENGLVERSFVQHIDVTFNETAGLAALVAGINDADPAASSIRLLRFGLDGSGPGVDVPLANKVTAVDHVLSFDFGAGGIGGNAGSVAGNGYYELEFDLNNNGVFDTVRHFYRLLGDVNGDHMVDSADIAAIAAAIGQSGPALNADVNGDLIVDNRDRQFALQDLGQQLANGLPLDD